MPAKLATSMVALAALQAAQGHSTYSSVNDDDVYSVIDRHIEGLNNYDVKADNGNGYN
jgi:hypothetical protein